MIFSVTAKVSPSNLGIISLKEILLYILVSVYIEYVNVVKTCLFKGLLLRIGRGNKLTVKIDRAKVLVNGEEITEKTVDLISGKEVLIYKA